MKQVWYVSPGSTTTLVGHTCRGNVRLLRHRLSRNHRTALNAGRAVYRLETCPYCHRMIYWEELMKEQKDAPAAPENGPAVAPPRIAFVLSREFGVSRGHRSELIV